MALHVQLRQKQRVSGEFKGHAIISRKGGSLETSAFHYYGTASSPWPPAKYFRRHKNAGGLEPTILQIQL